MHRSMLISTEMRTTWESASLFVRFTTKLFRFVQNSVWSSAKTPDLQRRTKFFQNRRMFLVDALSCNPKASCCSGINARLQKFSLHCLLCQKTSERRWSSVSQHHFVFQKRKWKIKSNAKIVKLSKSFPGGTWETQAVALRFVFFFFGSLFSSCIVPDRTCYGFRLVIYILNRLGAFALCLERMDTRGQTNRGTHPCMQMSTKLSCLNWGNVTAESVITAAHQ